MQTKVNKGEGGCKKYIFLQMSFMEGPLAYLDDTSFEDTRMADCDKAW